jgi:ABC-type nitrate/sulfonate/bicarbonate transport system substrate-binding protein
MRNVISVRWFFGFWLVVFGLQPPHITAKTPPGSQPAALETVVFGIPSLNANFLPLVVAETKGYYRPGGISASVQAIKSQVAIAGATSGEVPYTFTSTSVISAAMQGLPLRAVAFINVGSFFLFADPEIRSIADLKGKTIAQATLGGLQDHLLRTMLRAHGLDPAKDVNFIYLGDESLGVGAIKTGRVQAGIAQLPTPLVAEKEGLRILGNTATYAQFPTSAIGTSLARLKSRPAEVKAVIRGTLLGIKYVKDNLEDSAAILARWQKMPLELARRTLELMAPSWLDNGFLTDDQIRAVIDERRKPLNVTRDVAVSDVAEFQLLYEVHKDLGLRK